MEIPEMNMISDFEAGMKCLQNPSLISRFFSFQLVPQLFSFWKWGALIFAIYATFISVIKRIRLMFIRLHRVKPYFQQNEKIIEFNEHDDISLTSSSDSEDEQEEEEEEEEEGNILTTLYSSQRPVDEDFRVKGQKGNLRQFDWSEFTSGKNVVKLWDSLSLGLNFVDDFDCFDCSNDVVSKWEFSGRSSNSPAVVLTAEGNKKGNGVVFRGYDARMRSLVPALFAEWRSSGAGVMVGDVRNVRVPLENGKEFDGVTWWDTDAVIVEDDEYVLVDR